MRRSDSRGRTAGVARARSPSATRGRDARGRSVSQGRNTRPSPSPMGRTRASASPMPQTAAAQRKSSPHPVSSSPRPKSRKWSSADPVSKRVLEASVPRRHVSNTVARASQGLYDAKQFSRSKTQQQPTTPRSRTGLGVSTRYAMEPLPKSLTKQHDATLHKPISTAPVSHSMLSRGPGRDYKSTNEEAIKVMKRVKRLMSVLGDQEEEEDDILEPPSLQQQLEAQEMRRYSRPQQHHISPPKLQGAGHHVGHSTQPVSTFATPSVNKPVYGAPSTRPSTVSNDSYNRFNSEGFVRSKYADPAFVSPVTTITSPTLLRTSTGMRQQYMTDSIGAGSRFESRVGGPGGRAAYQSYHSTLQQALLHQKLEKEKEREARKLDYSSDNITSSDVNVTSSLNMSSELDLSAASRMEEKMEEEKTKEELSERIRTKETLLHGFKSHVATSPQPASPKPLPDRSILNANRAKSEELLILLSKSSPSKYSNPRSSKSTSPNDASPPPRQPLSSHPPPTLDTDIPPPPPSEPEPRLDAFSTTSKPSPSRVSWPVEPSPMRTDMVLPSLPLPSASPPEMHTSPARSQKDLQVPAVSPTVATERSISPHPVVVQSSTRSPQQLTVITPPVSPHSSGLSPSQHSLPPPPPTTPPKSPSLGRSNGLRTGNEEANIIRDLANNLPGSPPPTSPLRTSPSKHPERVFSPPPQPPQRSVSVEVLLQSLKPKEEPALEGASKRPDAPKETKEEEMDRCEQEAEWLRKAGKLYSSTGLTGTPDLGLLSMVITSKIVEPKNSEMRQLLGDTVAQAVGIARDKAVQDTMLGVTFGRMRVKSLAAQMKGHVGAPKHDDKKIAEEVSKICEHWADLKEADGLATDGLALTETLHATDGWKLSTKESRDHVLNRWTEEVLDDLLKDTVQYFNDAEARSL